MEEFRNVNEEIDLGVYLHILKRKAWLVMLLTVLFVGGSYVVSAYLMKPIYSASVSLFVGKESPSGQDQLNYNDVMMNTQLIKDYQVLVKSKLVADATISALGLSLSAEELSSQVSVDLQGDTRIFSITVQNHSPELARDIANQLSTVFMDKEKQIIKVQNVEIVDEAVLPSKPVKPKVLMNMAIGGVLGVMLAVFIIFIQEFLNNTFRTEEDIEKHLGLHALGIIPVIES